MKNIIIISFLLLINNSFGQEQKCEIGGEKIYSDAVKYIGECKNGKADGFGSITFSSGC